MGDHDSSLTAADWEAAREVLRRYPRVDLDTEWPTAEHDIAVMHQRWGPDTFRLRFGLREPNTVLEEYELKLFRGEVALDEAKENLRGYAQRPVDAQMLKTFFEEVGAQIRRHGIFMQEVSDLLCNPHRQPVTDEDEAELDRLADETRVQSRMDKREMHSVFDFLQEARVAKRMGRVQLGEFITPTAIELVTLVTSYARESWKANRATCRFFGDQAEVRAIDLFGMFAFRSLPRPRDLITLIDEEFALARIYLRERQAEASSAPATPVLDEDSGQPLLTVQHWSELAIGVDEKQRYWGLVPAPTVGQPFKKSKSIELPLIGDRWKSVLRVLAEAQDPNQVSRYELMQALDRLPPPTARNAMDSTQANQLAAVEANKQLNSDLKDLARKLRSFVQGPTGKGKSAFAMEGRMVLCRFTVRYLLPDDSGHLRFGDSPQ